MDQPQDEGALAGRSARGERPALSALHRRHGWRLSVMALGLSLAIATHAQAAAADPNTAPVPAASPVPEVTPVAAPAQVAAVAAPAPVAAAPVAAVDPAPAPALTGYDLLSMPKRMKYLKDYPVPEGYVVSRTPLRGLMVAGFLTFGVPYLAGVVITAGVNFSNEGGLLAIPVAGPIIWGLGHDLYGLSGLVLIDGGVQAIGLTMAILGTVIRRTELIRVDLATLSVVPTQMGRGGYGLAAVGTF